MAFTKRLCLFIIIIGLCATTYKELELIYSLVSTMKYFLQFCYILSSGILIDVATMGFEELPFFISKCSEITAEEFFHMEISFFISKFKEFKKENVMKKADDNPILILGYTLLPFFIFVLNEWLRYVVKVSRPHVKVFQDPLSIKTAVSESVRANIHRIETDLIVSESNLIDELQINGYLHEYELTSLKKRNRTDQAHFFAQRLEVMDDESFLEVVDILNKCSFVHIASALKSSYNLAKCEPQLQSETQHLFCPICRLKREVDIKELRSDLKKEDLLPFKLYRDINEVCSPTGHQDELWKELFYHFKSCGQRSVETRFLTTLNTPKHRGLYKCFQRNFPTHFECGCNTPYLFRALHFYFSTIFCENDLP